MKRALSLLIVALIVLMSMSVAFAAGGETVAVKASKSIVRVYVEGYNQTLGVMCYGTGTAVAVGKSGENVKYFVTNRHVIADEEQFTVLEFENTFGLENDAQVVALLDTAWNTGVNDLILDEQSQIITVKWTNTIKIVYDNLDNAIPANITARSDRADLAVLSLNTPMSERVPAKLREFDGDKVDLRGQSVTALGFPAASDNGLNQPSQSALYSSVEQVVATGGLINRVIEPGKSENGIEEIEHGAKINPGNSGGALVDSDGNVIGINTRKTYSGTAVDSVFFAISSNEVIRFLDENKIPYEKAGNGSALLWIIIGAVVLIAAIVACILVARSKNKKPTNVKPTGNVSGKRTLVCELGQLQGKAFPITGRVVIGTDASRCSILLPAGTGGVSRVHCTLTFDGNAVTVNDENSSYGTFIDDIRLQPGKPVVLHRGHKLCIGSKKECFVLHS